MAQYQILARKPLGPSGTSPKQTLEVKKASQHRLGFAARRAPAACTACGTLPHAARAPARNGCSRGQPPARTPRAGAGSDQIHKESGTSKVGGGRSPNPVHDWIHGSFVSLH
ncbi:Hyaluronan mediated motility receptor-like protein [Dorcoceras hygrometricum]|uniref:Hyaluronan mediated motility receptor-like protein n=1 Tax=Dorcoceras hygrometricum TaxID=472368 RepID=A0A2Z7AEZ7_9LAMI|nr:Hyaluronan mediated motility receptor-like protein [Dorcoceras hygrometricum]